MSGGTTHTTSSLSQMEKELQSVLAAVESFSFKDGPQHKQDACKQFETDLRQRMRLLRRWRNGTEATTDNDSRELSQFLARARRLAIDVHMSAVYGQLEKADILMRLLGEEDAIASSLRQDIGCEFVSVRENLARLSGDIRDEDFIAMNKEITELEKDFIILLKRLEKSKKSFLSGSKRKSRMKSKGKIKRIEDHPLVNHVLRNAGRIRRMMEAFRSGGHVTTDGENPETEGESSRGRDLCCLENDMEVLRRQLRKVLQWQQCSQEFNQSDIEDLELILTAIGRHIRPDVQLDAVVKRRKRKSFLSTGSECSSRSSEISDENSYVEAPPLSQEAPPAYEDACCTGSAKGHEDNNNQDSGDSSQEDSILDERLI